MLWSLMFCAGRSPVKKAEMSVDFQCVISVSTAWGNSFLIDRTSGHFYNFGIGQEKPFSKILFMVLPLFLEADKASEETRS